MDKDINIELNFLATDLPRMRMDQYNSAGARGTVRIFLKNCKL